MATQLYTPTTLTAGAEADATRNPVSNVRNWLARSRKKSLPHSVQRLPPMLLRQQRRSRGRISTSLVAAAAMALVRSGRRVVD